ncbi:glycine betaine ABC transporter substrate-binding protein [soil metagenome]
MRTRKYLATALVALLALLLAACGETEGFDDSAGGDDGGDTDATDAAADDAATGGEDAEGAGLEGATITVGSKDFDEQLVLGSISKLLLSDAGAEVVDEINTGGTDAVRGALTGGSIDHYWEYNGTAWISFFGETEPIPDVQEQYQVVADRDLEENDLVWLQPAPFNNTYGLAMASDVHSELGSPATLSDIGPLLEEDPGLTICVEVEFQSRDDGLPGMEETYGYSFDSVEVLDTGLIYTETAEGNCTFGEVFISDGRIAALDLVVLEDDQGFFPLYNPSPVFRSEVYDPVAEELDALYSPVTEALTLEVMQDLNARVSADGERPEAVAEDWLTENGFIGG